MLEICPLELTAATAHRIFPTLFSVGLPDGS